MLTPRQTHHWLVKYDFRPQSENLRYMDVEQLILNILMQRYDTAMYSSVFRHYYGESGYFNLGYWYDDTQDQRQASENLVEQLLNFLPERCGTILDVACGTGATTKYLLKYFDAESIVGINMSIKQLESARVNAPGCDFSLMDATVLAFDASTFDNVLCVEAAPHFNPRERFVEEAYRVLRPGGRLILSDAIFGSPVPMRCRRRPPQNNLTDVDHYRSLYLGAGFQDVQVVDVTDVCWGAFRRNVLRWVWQKLRARQINGLDFVRIVLGPLIGIVTLRRYFLVSARKG